MSDLLPRGQVALFDTSNLVRMDQAGRVATYTAALGAGIYTVNEVRALEGLPVVPDATPQPVTPNVEGL
jgi:phage portal protein BeeE